MVHIIPKKSNSDPNIARSINFFVSNLLSFKKYKDTDDLSFIIIYNRLLTIELFEYYSKKTDTSLRTLEGRFVAIYRIFYIAYDTKQYEYTINIAIFIRFKRRT